MSKRGTCWQGYEQKGMKKKGNKMVPNCVPAGMKTGGHTDNIDNIGPQSVYKKPTINKMPVIRPSDRRYYGKLLDV